MSFYKQDTENYALSNFDDNHGQGFQFIDPHLGRVHFSTAAHYLFFQKIKPEFKQSYYQLWQNEKDPNTILRGINEHSSPYYLYNEHHAYMIFNQKLKRYTFNPAWNNDKIYIQMQINAAKYQQSQAFRDCIHKAIQLGLNFDDGDSMPATIIADSSSFRDGKTPEEEWGTGASGRGKNILGNTLTAFAHLLQKSIGSVAPKLMDYTSSTVIVVYHLAEDQYKEGVQKALITIREQSGFDKGLSQPDTSELSPEWVEKVQVLSTELHHDYKPPQDEISQPIPEVVSSVKKTKKTASIKDYYAFATHAQDGRFHFFKATSKVRNDLKGDALKTAILNQFQSRLESCSTLDEFNNEVTAIKKEEDYQILAKGQGLLTRLFNLETSSKKAFDRMVADFRLTFSSDPKP